jgi:phosphoglycolate phosphatase
MAVLEFGQIIARYILLVSELQNSSMPYALAIFDLDGTLADSFPWFLRTINDIADRFGFRRVRDEDVEGLRHASTREILAHLEVPLWKLPAIARHARRLKGQAAAEIPLFAGVEGMLRTLTEGGVQLALVTSDSEANAREKLGEAAALFSHFDCSASVFGKPVKFRRVIRRAGVEPQRVISIGDEVRDIDAARAVRIACGAVCWGYAAPPALRAREPDFIFEQMDEIADAFSRDRKMESAPDG